MKMKSGKMSIKLNLLAILLMAALLVATLTSCGSQGEKGERGAKGDRGENGADGETPYIGENQNWWIGNVDTGVSVSGENGSNGVDGATPKFKFDETTHILSVSYDGVVWESLIDLSVDEQSEQEGALAEPN